MNTLTALSTSLICLIIISDDCNPRPVEEEKTCRNESHRNGPAYNPGRFRRSIPEIDAVNPAYFDVESQPDQEQPMDPHGDVSPFSLTDQVGSLFRSHKLGKQAQKTHARPGQHERAVNLVKDDSDSMVDGGMPADEQDDCYKQQNIEPPSLNEPLRGKGSKNQEPHSMPVMDVPQEPLSSNERDHVRDVSSGETHFERQEVDSLYSDPEQVIRLRKNKYPSQKSSQEVLNEYNRVYKPVGVKPDFPIYDEDIDFHPDPLQGILDDKYWLDPQEQEAVVRKYIDLAANNMMPPETEYEKRNADKSDHKVKSVSSKIGFKDIDSQCPCKEISACGDCSKGKAGKKTNYSDSDVNIPCGRKLLSIDGGSVVELNDEEVNLPHISSISSNKEIKLSNENFENYKPSYDDGNYEEIQNEDNYQNLQSYTGRKLLSFDDLYADEVSNSIILGDSIDELHTSNNYFGRHVLSFGYHDANEDSYNDYDYNGINNVHSVFNENIPQSEMHEKQLPKLSINLGKDYTNLLPKKEENEELKDSGPHEYVSDELGNQNIKNEKIPVISLQNKPPGYYMPNRLRNMFQRPFQENQKSKKKNITDPTYEFEVMRNQTLRNVTFEATSEKPPRPKICFKRGYENHLNAPKNRRSYSNAQTNGKNSQVVPLFQNVDGPMGSGDKEGNNIIKSEPNSSTKTTTNSKTVINCTVSGSNITTVSPNKTSNSSKAKFDDRDAEENVDTGVAKEIVESVISESQKSSGLGHNLGICKRNESVTKIKYGRIVPEAEKVIKTVTDCIMDRIKAHLAKQSCILLDDELLEFLKWLVLSGESYKDYMLRLGPKYYDFVPVTTPANAMTCEPPSTAACEQEPLPPNPNLTTESA